MKKKNDFDNVLLPQNLMQRTKFFSSDLMLLPEFGFQLMRYSLHPDFTHITSCCVAFLCFKSKIRPNLANG